MSIKVKHYRTVDEKFNKLQKGGVTVAYELLDDSPFDQFLGQTAWFGVAVCHPDDNFSKVDGHDLADSRLTWNKVYISPKLINLVGGDVHKAVEHLIDGYLTVNYGIRIYTNERGRQITYRLG